MDILGNCLVIIQKLVLSNKARMTLTGFLPVESVYDCGPPDPTTTTTANSPSAPLATTNAQIESSSGTHIFVKLSQ